MKWIKDWFQRRRDDDDARVLRVFIQDMGRHHGFEISRAAGMKAGSVYPSLTRLCNGGWLDSGWDEEPIPGTNLRRRWYQISDKAISVGDAVLKAENGS